MLSACVGEKEGKREREREREREDFFVRERERERERRLFCERERDCRSTGDRHRFSYFLSVHATRLSRRIANKDVRLNQLTVTTELLTLTLALTPTL